MHWTTKLLMGAAVVFGLGACTVEREVSAVPAVVETQTTMQPGALSDTQWMAPPPGDWDYYYVRREITRTVP